MSRKKSKNKMKHLTTKEIIERRRSLTELKRLIREPVSLKTHQKDPNNPDKMIELKPPYEPKGWAKMSTSQKKINSRRIGKHEIYAKQPAPKNSIKVHFSFLPSELGILSPTEEEISLIKETDPKRAQKMKYYNEAEHPLLIPHVYMRNPNVDSKLEWEEERQRVKQQFSQRYQNYMQEEIVYDPNGPTLDLSNLTTAGTNNEEINS